MSWNEELSLKKDVDLICSTLSIDRKTARIYLMRNINNRKIVFTAVDDVLRNQVIDDLMKDKGLQNFSFEEEKSQVAFSFNGSYMQYQFYSEAEILQDIIQDARKYLSFPKRVEVHIRRYAVDMNLSLLEIAEKYRIRSLFEFTLFELPVHELISDVEEVPDTFIEALPHFSNIEFENRFKCLIRVIDEDSPCFGDEFIVYFFSEKTESIFLRYWVFFDFSTPVCHELVTNENGYFFNDKKDTIPGTYPNRTSLRFFAEGKDLYNRIVTPDLTKVFSSFQLTPRAWLNMLHFPTQRKSDSLSHLLTNDQRIDLILFERIKTVIERENGKVKKIEEISKYKVKRERASLEYFILSKRKQEEELGKKEQEEEGKKRRREEDKISHATTIDIEGCALFDIFTHEKNILQSIVLFTNDWLSIVSAKLVSRVE